MSVHQTSRIGTDSDSEHDPDSLLDKKPDDDLLSSYDELKKKLEEVEEKLTEKVQMLDDRTRHLAQDGGASIQDDCARNVEQDEEMLSYPKDTYSFLALHGPMKNPSIFFFGFAMFLLQVAFNTLLLLSILAPSLSSRDFFDGTNDIFPGDVELLVKIVQILSIVVHVMIADYSMDDLISAVNLFPNINKAQEDDPLHGLVLSSCLRFIQAIAANLSTVFLVFTSLTAKEVILNFAAINFISRLDDAGFSSVVRGHFGKDMRNMALQIEVKRLPACVIDRHRPFMRIHFVMLSTFALMISFGLGFVLVPQTAGDFLINTFRIEFEAGTDLETYNGCYDFEELPVSMRLRGFRPVYTSRTSTNKARFAYCKTELKWYLIDSDRNDGCIDDDTDPIGKAYSSFSFSYDIQDVFSEPFYSMRGTPLNPTFFISDVGIRDDGCKALTANGKCEEVLNIAAFEFDGGDCCGATCNHPECGLGVVNRAFESDLDDVVGDGYQNCLDPVMANVSIILNEVKVETYAESEWPFNMVNSSPPLLRFDCNGQNHLMINVEEEMENKTELIRVEDGAKCKVLIRSGHVLNFTLLHSMMLHNGTRIEANIVSQAGINDLKKTGEEDFQLFPKCYFTTLLAHLDVDTVYSNKMTPKRKALDWLLSDKSSYSECDNPFFIERYALAASYYSMLGNLTLPIDLPDGMERHESQCIWPFVTCSSGHVVTLNLNGNQLSGTIPTELAMMTKLTSLDLRSNQIKGTIPTELATMMNLEYLSLNGNQLNGTIPTELALMTNLEDLFLVYNQLSGTIPTELGKMTNLSSLSLFYNQLSGSIPTELGIMTNLASLALDDNQLSGTIPTELGTMTNLKYLRLFGNPLSGTIPKELGKMTNLLSLSLSNNDLTGNADSIFCQPLFTSKIFYFILGNENLNCSCCYFIEWK